MKKRNKKLRSLKKETKKENILLKKFLFFIYKNLYNIDLYFNIEKQHIKRNNKLNDKYYNYYKIL